MDQDYWRNHHDQKRADVALAKCPIGYGDCNNDDECIQQNGFKGLCSQQRDLDNIDLCIQDLDPCGDVLGATGTMCVVWTAVGGDFHNTTNSHIASRIFFGGALLTLGTLVGFYLTRTSKGEEHRYLLEEEI